MEKVATRGVLHCSAERERSCDVALRAGVDGEHWEQWLE